MRPTSRRRPARSILPSGAAAAVVAMAVLAPTTSAGALVPAPSITATPDNVMVNTTTVLTGRGLARHTTVHIVECAATSWYVLASPCDTTNAINVRTNARGTFTATFRVGTCPTAATVQPGGGPAFLCYIGVPRISGIDTESLQPGTAIVVTYP